MSRLLEGRSVHVPVVTSIDDSTEGASMLVLADRTASFGHVRPQTTAIWVNVTGTSGSITLTCYVRLSTQADGDLGWAVLHDTNNPGVLGGDATTPGAHLFLVSFATIFDEFVLLASGATGDAAIDPENGAIMIAYDERVLSK